MTIEDIVSHLYVTEAYYFNPKQVKRTTLVKLVGMLQANFNKPSPSKAAPRIQTGEEQHKVEPPQKRAKNFFERKRFMNYDNVTGS